MFTTLLHSRLSKATSITLVACLLVHDIKPSSSDDQIFPAALLRAVQINDLNLVKALIESGTSVNTSPSNYPHKTPLREALLKGHKKIAHLLLKNGAGMNSKDLSPQNTLLELVEEGYTAIAKRLLNQPNKPETHINALHREYGKTLLHAVCMLKQEATDKARFLLDMGADVHQTDNEGRTPLFDATYHQKPAITRLLLENGADVNQTDSAGCTALFDVAGLGYYKIVKFLIDNGADVNLTNKQGKTCLFSAASNGHLQVAQLISTSGSGINQSDVSDFNTTYRAIEHKPYLADFLFSKGAHPNTVNSQNKSLLQVAIEDRKDQVIAYLLGKKATIDSKTLTMLQALNTRYSDDRQTLLRAAMGFNNAGQLETFKSYLSSEQWMSIQKYFTNT